MCGYHAASGLPRSLMLRVVLAKVKSTNPVGLVILANHVVTNADLLNALAKDIRTLIIRGSTGRRVPHKPFAEAYYLHQASLAGKMRTNCHVSRLHGIGIFAPCALAPPQLFHTVPARTAVPNKRGMIENVEGAGCANEHIIRDSRYPHLAASSRKPAIRANAAIAISNASVTCSQHCSLWCLASRQRVALYQRTPSHNYSQIQ